MSKLWTRLCQSDALVGVGLFAASIFLWTQTTGLRGNASLMPRIVLTAIALCALVMIGQTLIAPLRREDISPIDRKQLALAIATVVIYVLIISYVGFHLTTLLFFLCEMLVFGVRKPVWLVSVPVCALGFVMFVFEWMFSIQVPAGVIF